ncbi:MAG: DNA primase [Nocardioidaceae bacterium]|nr:DNA primase [Nocardioidaceae bacterium]MDQ3325832.1 DNA primase [Actinomycetota bacterium]
MAGRIRDEDIATVRERAAIDDVVSAYVTLRGAGGGSQKGLCPFHDEKTPSFTVTPARQYFHCFGCGQGGDVFTFLQQIEGLSFVEAAEKLAARFGVELRYTEGGPRSGGDHGQRQRLVEANRLAQQFYAAQLAESAEAVPGRQFLAERGFDRDVADRFGVGFAPRSGEALLRHLRGRDVRDDDLVAAGLVGRSSRGLYDRFRGRLLWPIRELSGEVVGFGARRLFDDDRIDAKYLNTAESPLYKKSHLLYGVDLARREIARAGQAVVVEGYTDVMACHLAGVPTAVATCGTAFGADHVRVLRRLLLDHDEFRGEVIFTFDGDEAGQRAALKAFDGDQQFVAQTYVAVEPGGMDPCDLRLQHGDAAVRELVASRVPLYRFVLRNVVDRYDLERADGRIDAVRAAASLVASVRDRSKVDAFARELAGMVGVDPDDVRGAVRHASRQRQPARRPAVGDRNAQVVQGEALPPDTPSVGDPRFTDEREALKAVVQHPQLVPDPPGLDATDFHHPLLQAVWTAVAAAPLPRGAEAGWFDGVRERAGDATASVLSRLAVEPLRTAGEPDARLVAALLARLQELTAARRIEEIKSRLQRTNPVEQASDYNRMFGELVALEQHRRQLRERAIGSIG